MRILLFITVFFLSYTEFGFRGSNCDEFLIKNDTTKAIELSIQKSFYRHTMPEVEFLIRSYKSGDSILFTSEKKFLRYLPSEVDSLKFKIIEKKNICSLLASDTTWKNRHYLSLQYFERRNNKFEIVLVNKNCNQYTSGGGLGISIIKDSDSLKVIHIGAFNIN